MAQDNEKTALEHVNDFFKGIFDTAVGAPIALGDFIARISGYRDYQLTKDSVFNLDSDSEQKQALNELRIIYEAVTHKESLKVIKDVLVKDIEERPAYYFGGIVTSFAIGRTLTEKGLRVAYSATTTGTKVEQKIHELYEIKGTVPFIPKTFRYCR